MIQSVNGGLAPGEQPSEVALTDLMDLRGQARGCLELANHYQKTGDPRKALFVLVPLTEWVPSEERETTYSLMGLTFGALGQWSQAEEALRQAQELLPAKPDAAAVGKFVSVSIALSDALSKQGRIAEEAELELVAALTRLQKMLPKAELNRSPDVAKLYVRLAQVLKGRPRSKDRANYYRLAEKNLAAAEKAYPAKAAEIAALKSQIPGAKKALTPPKGQAKEPGPAPESALSPPLPAGLPSPELLRLEMSGYRLIDRLSEFEPRIAGALATAQSPEGRDAPYPKYLSLWLKFLEENGDEERLLSELDRLAENPLGSSPNARSQFILAALNYKARVLAKGDRKEEALAIYRRMSKDPTLSQSLTKDQMQDLAASVKSLESPAD
jgi:tetratricopeptide (TPR) repeat protein